VWHPLTKRIADLHLCASFIQNPFFDHFAGWPEYLPPLESWGVFKLVIGPPAFTAPCIRLLTLNFRRLKVGVLMKLIASESIMALPQPWRRAFILIDQPTQAPPVPREWAASKLNRAHELLKDRRDLGLRHVDDISS